MSDSMRRLMQEHLDGQLDENTTETLYDYLDADADAAREYARLETVDHILRNTTHARAPQRLAATIMARLAESIEREAKLDDLPEGLRQAILMSISLVTVSMMPMMIAASYLVMSGKQDPKVIHNVIDRTVALMLMMIDGLAILMKELEQTVHDNPELATAALTLVPMTLSAMLDYIEGEHTEIFAEKDE